MARILIIINVFPINFYEKETSTYQDKTLWFWYLTMKIYNSHSTSSYLILDKKLSDSSSALQTPTPSRFRWDDFTQKQHKTHILPPQPDPAAWVTPEGRRVSASEEKICHWSSWGEAWLWRTGLCLWNERMTETVTQNLMCSAAFCQHTERTHTQTNTHTHTGTHSRLDN